MRGMKFLIGVSALLALVAGAIWTGQGQAPPRTAVVAPWGETPLFDYGGEGGLVPEGVGPGFQAAADHIVAQQCPSGAWCWPHGSGCCGGSEPHNITAPIALGVLHAYSITGDPAHLASAVAGGDGDIADFKYPNGESRFGTFTPFFMWELTAASADPTYSTHAETKFFDELTAGTYGPSDYDTAGWIAAVQAGRAGTWINLLPWEFHTLIHTATAIGNAGQDTLFEDALLDGLDTLDNTDPANVYSDLIGLAGGVRGLAFAGTTSFPAINAPKHAGINGIDKLVDLADKLAAYQNADGSWYWHSNLSSPAEDDKDTQTSAYAVMALEEADTLVDADYSAEVAAGRDWLRSMQLPDGGFLSYPGGTSNTEVEGEATNALETDPCTDDKLVFELAAGSDCVKPSETVTVELWQKDLDQLVRGFQAFAQFDSTLMTFGSGTYTSTPYGLPIIDPIAAVGDDIDVAAGIISGTQSPTQADALLVTLEFTAGATEGPTTVSFRYHDPPSRFSDEFGAEVVPCLIESPTVIIDGTDPVITCPPDISKNADAGKCEANITPGTATATDNLDPNPLIEYKRSDRVSWNVGLLDPYPSGVTTITWRATDCAGNVSTCDQDITVFAFNEMVVDIELDGTVAAGPFTRCVTFELWECGTPSSVTVDEVMTFTGGVASATVLVPCGDYECITARDKLHTLRRTIDPLPISGTQYVADFQTAGKDLVGGNLNNDYWVDILDFGLYSLKYGTTPGANTTCATSSPHADINGDDTVDTADFTFIQVNFLAGHEPNCCGQPGDSEGPITSITLAELKARGLGRLKVADLNNDGVLDEADMAAFMQGARPNKPNERPIKRAFRGARSSQRQRP